MPILACEEVGANADPLLIRKGWRFLYRTYFKLLREAVFATSPLDSKAKNVKQFTFF